MQLARLDGRLPAYVSGAVREHADFLGTQYLEKIAAVREVFEQLAGMSQFLDLPYREKAEFPTFRVASLEDSDRFRVIAAKRGATDARGASL